MILRDHDTIYIPFYVLLDTNRGSLSMKSDIIEKEAQMLLAIWAVEEASQWEVRNICAYECLISEEKGKRLLPLLFE